MKGRLNFLIVVLLLACSTSQVRGETVYFFAADANITSETIYFLVAEANTPNIGDSYVLPLTEPNDIAHARDLIKYGTSAGEPIVVAQITCGPDYINRDYLGLDKPIWCWNVIEFISFEDSTDELLDGSPSSVEDNCWSWIDDTGGYIGFWTYTVVAELGTNPKHWRRNFNDDNDVDFADFDMLGSHWVRTDCGSPDWCSEADLDFSGTVDFNDLKIFTEAWLSPFATEPASDPILFPCWYSYECRYQCYGDADCATENLMYHVYLNDLEIIVNIAKSVVGGFPCKYPSCIAYNPCCDFDRDFDVDEDDLIILETNLKKRDSDLPGPCPTCR